MGAASAAIDTATDIVQCLWERLQPRRLSHGRLAWHHFFPEWLATLRFISGKKDPTLPALRSSSQARRPHGVGSGACDRDVSSSEVKRTAGSHE